MKRNITVLVPIKRTVSYSLFAQGLPVDVPKDSEDKTSVAFTFLGGTVFCLFYTFSNFRRAYIVTEWKNEDDGEALHLPGVEAPLAIILKAKGRKIDDLKHALFILTKREHYYPFRLKVEFWKKLALMIELRGSRREEVVWLFNKYAAKGRRITLQ